MVNKDIPISFQLQENEKVLLQESVIGAPKYIGFLLFILMLGMDLFVIGFSFSSNINFRILILLNSIVACFFVSLGLFAWDSYNRDVRYTLFITNLRAIKFPRKSFLPYKSKKKEIFIDNIDYITFDWAIILIVEKGLNREPHFKGDEEEYKNRPKGINSITYHLRINQESNLREKTLDLLIDLTNAKKHSNLSDVYISMR